MCDSAVCSTCEGGDRLDTSKGSRPDGFGAKPSGGCSPFSILPVGLITNLFAHYLKGIGHNDKGAGIEFSNDLF